ncbi:MAG TPA: sulfatase-like hydrolase/transferase [Firmicutes bacterium]|nr:sulfatase-like hydrolase/transferase [Bacillota bacterium]
MLISDNIGRPNIVLIVTDQWRGDCLGVEGRKGLDTPNLDALAIQGVRCTHAYTPCPSCIAARRTILSGQYPSTHGLIGYVEKQEWMINDTLPAVLKRAGYHTYLAGRHMHQYPLTKRFGYDHVDDWNVPSRPSAYQRWLAKNAPADAGDMYGHGIGSNDWVVRPWHLPEYMTDTYWTTERALEFLEWRDASCPFFMTVSYFAPHPPLVPPEFYLNRYLRRDLGNPVCGSWASPPINNGIGQRTNASEVVLTGTRWQECAAGYYGLINYVDDQLHRLLAKLPKNTYVLFTSDHGEMLGDHYRFRKVVPYEGSARVPFLLYGPGIPPNTVINEPVCLTDIMPTILDLAGVPIPPTVDGRSILPLINRPATPPEFEWRQYVHIEHSPCYSPDEGYQCITDGIIKYIWWTADGKEQLFHLEADPHELNDLAGDPENEDILTKWRTRMITLLQGRPEGFSDGDRLIPGRQHKGTLPWVMDGKRRSGGEQLEPVKSIT